MAASSFLEFLDAQLANCDTQWSVGTFGALAEFTRDRHEAAAIRHSDSDVSAVTSRGGIRISPSPNIRLVASESATRTSWNHRVALCLREEDSAMTQRDVLTELGTDTQSLRDCDRDAILFDLGLAAHQIDACVRVSDPAVVADLRACSGRNVFEAGNPAMRVIVSASPHRVFVSRIGRIEVFQPIPPPGGSSPEGPHTHVLPKLLQHRRTHPATEQVPPNFVPCAHFYPAHPTKDVLGCPLPFDADRHSLFQEMFLQFGNDDAIEIKRRVVTAIDRGEDPSRIGNLTDRFARVGVRVTLRQLQASREPSPTLAAWLQAHDRPHINSEEMDDAEAIHQHA